MSCNNNCKLCDRLIISTAVTYDSGVLTVTIPEGPYRNHEKYCIVIAQSIPLTAIIGAPVVIQIGDGAVMYPLNKCDCTQATVCNIRTRTKYPVKVITNASGGIFRLLRKVCCAPDNSLFAIDGTAPTS